MTEQTFESWDGTKLFYRAWLPQGAMGGRATRAIYLFHRGHEHSARWEETVRALGMAGTAFFAWDQRGHGNSPGARGHAETFAALTKDADAFGRHVVREYGIGLEDSAVVATSMGAVIATGWVHDFAPRVRGMALAAPAFRVRLYVPLAIPGLRMMQRVMPRMEVKSFVTAKMVTHDEAEAKAYDADKQIFRQIAVNMLLDLHDAGKRLVEDAGAIQTPTLVLTAGKDAVVSTAAQREFYQRLGAEKKQLEFYPEMFHAMFHESRRSCVTDRIRAFLQECFLAAPRGNALVEADEGGFTRTEYDVLRTPESIKWPLVRGVLKVAGGFSKGIRLGWQTGFDSGVTLDYVYENKARGVPVVGTMMDRGYLDSPGWRGIRVRRKHIEKFLDRAIAEQVKAGERVHIVDVASGPGRYVLETIARHKDAAISAVLRDYKDENVAAARALADALKLPSIETIAADAFDRGSLASLVPKPTIAITSGIFELFSENEKVLATLRGLADAMDAGTTLIYTAQIWHPQIEFIARALRNHQGKPWVMRRRTQAEMDALVRAAGFEKLEQEIDQWGIFTVSRARRVRS